MNAVQTVNPLKKLQDYGQSVWLDYIRRNLITSGELQRLIDEDGLRGVTSNPSIFEKAIAGSNDYDEALAALEQEQDLEAMALFERLAIEDIQKTADILRPVYEQTERHDGYISLEVSPYLANDTEATIAEARRLWGAVNRENLMIKVPATPAGIPAIRQLISEGINVNVTLLFAQQAYAQVVEAYLEGLEAFAASGGELSRVASVASFFVSRIDTAVDALLQEKIKSATSGGERAVLNGLLGKVAIANARLAYQHYKEIYRSDRWHRLADTTGAQPQRLLWASTSTKNPNYRDVLYVEELIGPNTVDTIPPATFDAFRDHGRPRASLDDHLEEAYTTLKDLEERAEISLAAVTDQLVSDGVRLFADAFDKLLSTVEKRRQGTLAAPLNTQSYKLGAELESAVKAELESWQVGGKVRRLWARDASLWTGADENNWLGWLGITDDQLAHLGHLKDLASEVKQAGFSQALLLGMGGSSLGPEVLKLTFGPQPGYPELLVLDSTDPEQIRSFENRIDLANTLFIVSSKSGGTLEPNIFKQYFFERVRQTIGDQKAGERFIAVTDPGSKMQQVAEGDHFRHTYFGLPSIGGRYSVLSDFGMVPGAIQGIDVPHFLDVTERMVHACAASVPAEDNPGVVLGAILGVLAKTGRDKVTIVASPGIADLGAWLEQLLAESTGKEGKGLIPVAAEPLGTPEVYGADRLFAYIRLETAPDAVQDAAVAALEGAGQPVVRIGVSEPYQLGQEFFRWEIATAVAGSIIGINAFNQPDVEASKVATRKLTGEYEKTGQLPPETPIFEEAGIKLYTDERNAGILKGAVGPSPSLAAYLRALLDTVGPGDYLALLAYIERNGEHTTLLQNIRQLLRDAKHSATCLGFGPRFLHSTGQAYKGGPNTGVFLQITADVAEDLDVPGQKYTFGVVKAAQARGDFEVLAQRQRRALRVHLGADVTLGLAALQTAIEQALG
ncbi:bifunctional transaldolase/phosoglucose isomerase [Gloeobacter kilaueensis]|uniref:Transaldolase n=1 Tax=Gloeobacter kilaueensis (strain ATCC BAA-2537 / CCAP 1431/1 / ULC 316 / JS1) TaxID=1183438 RepID=U5QNC7_GLOK1|nr:bifunctional transaldolase/phosoglucose isomerase [Gloeobacter kilaueensis]AGY60492.1 bifunctional transaldolase/phosoglucose isomerase [Gloeobacter kilaueensis JS1]